MILTSSSSFDREDLFVRNYEEFLWYVMPFDHKVYPLIMMC